MNQFDLNALERLIAQRATSDSTASYTAKVVARGMPQATKKLGEEAVEAVIAAIQGDRPELIKESADVLYHLLVVLYIAGIPLKEVLDELATRTAQSGLAEKATRKPV
ncbi:HisI Phosphoribosyl-ATP pyrophosphohydrolase [Rhabdaerophilaceae bacterium]